MVADVLLTASMRLLLFISFDQKRERAKARKCPYCYAHTHTAPCKIAGGAPSISGISEHKRFHSQLRLLTVSVSLSIFCRYGRSSFCLFEIDFKYAFNSTEFSSKLLYLFAAIKFSLPRSYRVYCARERVFVCARELISCRVCACVCVCDQVRERMTQPTFLNDPNAYSCVCVCVQSEYVRACTHIIAASANISTPTVIVPGNRESMPTIGYSCRGPAS